MIYVLNLLAALGSLTAALAHANVSPQACSGGWEITGYYLPIQSDFANWDDFYSDVVMQGSGRLNDGTYMNWMGMIVDQPATSSGLPVQDGVVAFDPNYFPFGTIFWYNGQKYLAADTGGAIIGKHLDVYMGLGRDAQQRAFEITSFNQTVCWTYPQ